MAHDELIRSRTADQRFQTHPDQRRTGPEQGDDIGVHPSQRHLHPAQHRGAAQMAHNELIRPRTADQRFQTHPDQRRAGPGQGDNVGVHPPQRHLHPAQHRGGSLRCEVEMIVASTPNDSLHLRQCQHAAGSAHMHRVATAAPDHGIVTTFGIDGVIAAAADQGIGAAVAVDGVVPGAADSVLDQHVIGNGDVVHRRSPADARPDGGKGTRPQIDGNVQGLVAGIDGVGAAGIPDGLHHLGGGAEAVGIVAGVVAGVGAIDVLDGLDVVQHRGRCLGAAIGGRGVGHH